jgi:hypothetical protein
MTTGETQLPLAADDADKHRQIANVLLAKYGGDASLVAARQIEAATGAQRGIWEAIAALLSSDASHP